MGFLKSGACGQVGSAEHSPRRHFVRALAATASFPVGGGRVRAVAATLAPPHLTGFKNPTHNVVDEAFNILTLDDVSRERRETALIKRLGSDSRARATVKTAIADDCRCDTAVTHAAPIDGNPTPQQKFAASLKLIIILRVLP